ncbi:proline iminopeptidase [Sporothrix brasiliensis 5110]|uniref:Proline iminopeptidase n=1 Tax=Sporothrix brasiliensis 5110 TaxID=1398154 RepID=A0A0C2IVM8_9PEZI|nr:proline iminopeptidase [Sporothrix brasiliensis 5110]KIH89042.1 proline iminopeptidase [Sporothrix brasiliensis 5110]
MADPNYESPTGEALRDAKRPVDPATLMSGILGHDKSTDFLYNQLEYTVPLKHCRNGDRITVTVRVVLSKCDSDAAKRYVDEQPAERTVHLNPETPIAVYLVGGPGSDNPHTNNPTMTEFYLAKGFQVLFMDYRGTGSSTLQRADHLDDSLPPSGNAYVVGKEPSLENLTSDEQAEQLSWYRQDNIVRDLEAVRKSLLTESDIQSASKWTLVGQSYGGWVSFTYLSFYPEALHMVLLTGGIPPVGQSPKKVYEHTYDSVIKACDVFYDTYPDHVKNVRDVLKVIHDGNGKDENGTKRRIAMPGGGVLTPERFLCLGRTLGTTGGNDKVNDALNKFMEDIDARRPIRNDTLLQVESWLRFEERPLYAILQEPLYTESPNPPSAWAAQAAGEELNRYWWLQEVAFDRVFSSEKDEDKTFAEEHFDGKKIYMSAEHVYPFHYDQFKSLRPLKKAAEILAEKTDWPPLYDILQLRKNKVPISSLSYETDMFVDWRLSKLTVANMDKKYIVNDHDAELKHTAVKDKPEIVLNRVWENLGELAKSLVGGEKGDEKLETAVSVISVLKEVAAN